jgi:hypothetical protein
MSAERPAYVHCTLPRSACKRLACTDVVNTIVLLYTAASATEFRHWHFVDGDFSALAAAERGPHALTSQLAATSWLFVSNCSLPTNNLFERPCDTWLSTP